MTKIIWEEPPPVTTHATGKTQQFVEALKQRPGEWARYPGTYAQPSLGTVNKKRFPGTEWTSRKQEDKRYALWARWVGDPDGSR